jgi:hypothetical protein
LVALLTCQVPLVFRGDHVVVIVIAQVNLHQLICPVNLFPVGP